MPKIQSFASQKPGHWAKQIYDAVSKAIQLSGQSADGVATTIISQVALNPDIGLTKNQILAVNNCAAVLIKPKSGGDKGQSYIKDSVDALLHGILYMQYSDAGIAQFADTPLSDEQRLAMLSAVYEYAVSVINMAASSLKAQADLPYSVDDTWNIEPVPGEVSVIVVGGMYETLSSDKSKVSAKMVVKYVPQMDQGKATSFNVEVGDTDADTGTWVMCASSPASTTDSRTEIVIPGLATNQKMYFRASAVNASGAGETSRAQPFFYFVPIIEDTSTASSESSATTPSPDTTPPPATTFTSSSK